MVKTSYIASALFSLTFLLLLTGVACAIVEDWETGGVVEWEAGYSGPSYYNPQIICGDSYVGNTYDNCRIGAKRTDIKATDDGEWWIITPKSSYTYAGMLTFGYVSQGPSKVYFYFDLYDENDNLLASLGKDTTAGWQSNTDVLEVVISGTIATLFMNGGEVTSSAISGSVAKIRMRCYYDAASTYGYMATYMDLITTEGKDGSSVVSACEESYSDASSSINIWYMITRTDYYSLSSHNYTLTIRDFANGNIITTVEHTASKPYGKVSLDPDTTFGTNFSVYIAELKRDGTDIGHDFFFYISSASNDWVDVEREVYAPTEVASITYHLDNPDFSTYIYKLEIMDAVSGETKEEWALTKAEDTLTLNLEDFEGGLYYALLKRVGGSFEELRSYDAFQVKSGVFIKGVTYDAKTEDILPSTFVSYCQENVGCENTTSNATTGAYEVENLVSDYEIHVGAAKTNYTHNNFSFTPLREGLYEIDLFLLPDTSHINVTAPAIVGLTQSYPFRQNVSYATVNIWNETWNANTTTNSMGYFAFENLSPGTYYLNATREKFKSSQTYEVELTSGEIEYVYILMHEIYNLTIRARDAGTHSTIFEFRAILNDGEQEKETTTGKLNFSVEYGIHKVEVGADNYYSAVEYVYVCEDTEKIFYLTPFEGEVKQGVGISYPPHQVEFACVDIFGNPLANVYVEATPISTTTGAWDWLLNLFGIRNESISYYTNQTLNGTTDSRGAITFVMMENVEYEVRFVNESLEIDKTIRIYPKADHYTVVLTPTTSSITSSEDYITFNLSYEIVGDEINLSLTYNDALGQTQNLTFFVYNSTTLLYQQNFTNVSNVSVSYTVPYKAGEEYMWGYSAFHSRFGEMGRSRILRIAWFLDLGISRTYCTWIAIAIILFLTAMFSFTTVKFGYVAIPIVSLIFAFIGWLPNISIIIIALCLGILAYMGKREKEVGV